MGLIVRIAQRATCYAGALRRHGVRMFFGLRLLWNKQLAEDLISEVFCGGRPQHSRAEPFALASAMLSRSPEADNTVTTRGFLRASDFGRSARGSRHKRGCHDGDEQQDSAA